jgi:predicted dehydrogenase
MLTNKKLSIGLAGLGQHARKIHIPVIDQSPFFTLGGIASRFRTNSRNLPSDSKAVPVFEDYDDLLNSPEIDAIIISTANHLHGPLTIRALENGKHVLCEKPLSWKIHEIDKISQLLQSSKLILATGFMYRHHELYELLRDIFQKSPPREIIARIQYSGISDANIRCQKALGGGALLDIGCYLIDLGDFLLNQTDEIRGEKISWDYHYETNPQTGCDTNGILKFNFKGTCFYGSFSQNLPRNQHLQIWTKDSGLNCDTPFLIPRNKKVYLRKSSLNGNSDSITVTPCNVFERQLGVFSASILEGKLLPPLTDGLDNSRALAELYSMIKDKNIP